MSNKSHKYNICESCTLRESPLFKVFSEDDLHDLETSKSCSSFKRNQLLFGEGNIPRGVYLINQGKIKIYTTGEEGKEQIIHIAKAGEIVGFRAMFSGDPYKVSASTMEECRICFIGKSDFLNLVDSNKSLLNSLIRELSKELTERAGFIANMAQSSVRVRLAYVLMMLDDIYDGEMINMTREDLANFVGTATETLIRLLKDFKEEGLLRTHIRKIEILDRDRLLHMVK